MTASAAEKMDAIYRRQRFIYDATRRYYLLGRDRLIEEPRAPGWAARCLRSAAARRAISSAPPGAIRTPGFTASMSRRPCCGRRGPLLRGAVSQRVSFSATETPPLSIRSTLWSRRLRPCLHFLFAVDDPGVARRRKARCRLRCAGR